MVHSSSCLAQANIQGHHKGEQTGAPLVWRGELVAYTLTYSRQMPLSSAVSRPEEGEGEDQNCQGVWGEGFYLEQLYLLEHILLRWI